MNKCDPEYNLTDTEWICDHETLEDINAYIDSLRSCKNESGDSIDCTDCEIFKCIDDYGKSTVCLNIESEEFFLTDIY